MERQVVDVVQRGVPPRGGPLAEGDLRELEVERKVGRVQEARGVAGSDRTRESAENGQIAVRPCTLDLEGRIERATAPRDRAAVPRTVRGEAGRERDARRPIHGDEGAAAEQGRPKLDVDRDLGPAEVAVHRAEIECPDRDEVQGAAATAEGREGSRCAAAGESRAREARAGEGRVVPIIGFGEGRFPEPAAEAREPHLARGTWAHAERGRGRYRREARLGEPETEPAAQGNAAKVGRIGQRVVGLVGLRDHRARIDHDSHAQGPAEVVLGGGEVPEARAGEIEREAMGRRGGDLGPWEAARARQDGDSLIHPRRIGHDADLDGNRIGQLRYVAAVANRQIDREADGVRAREVDDIRRFAQ